MFGVVRRERGFWQAKAAAVFACALLSVAAVGCAAEAEADDGIESADALTEAKLPECASAPMRAIFEETKSTIRRGSVPAKLYATAKSAASSDVLMKGPEIFPAMATLMVSAEREVLFQTFAWDVDSDPARELLSALKRLEERRRAEGASGEPVVVRINIDTLSMSNGHMDRLARVSASIEALALDPAHVRVEIAGFVKHAFGSLHSKTLVVDGRAAVVTGANVEIKHDYAAPWHDTGYLLEGEVAEALVADFDYRWKKAQLWTCGGDEKAPADRCLRDTPRILGYVDRGRAEGDLAGACVPMLVTTRDGDGNPFGNRTDNTQDRAWLAAMKVAQHVVRIQSPNLNDDAAKRGILEAARRGVPVQLVLSKKFNEKTQNLPGQGGGNEENVRELYATLRSEGFTDACERLQVRWFSLDGQAPVEGNGPGASHTKYMSIDDAIVIVGSGNMDTQSWNKSHETNVVVDDAATTRAWDQQVFAPSFLGGTLPAECAAR